MWANTGDDKIRESKIVKLLRIIVKDELKFEKQINNVSMKVPGKLTMLMSLRNYLDLHKLRITIEKFS